MFNPSGVGEEGGEGSPNPPTAPLRGSFDGVNHLELLQSLPQSPKLAAVRDFPSVIGDF